MAAAAAATHDVGTHYEKDDGQVLVLLAIRPRAPEAVSSEYTIGIPENRPPPPTYRKRTDEYDFVNVRTLDVITCPMESIKVERMTTKTADEGRTVIARYENKVRRAKISREFLEAQSLLAHQTKLMDDELRRVRNLEDELNITRKRLRLAGDKMQEFIEG